MSSGSIFRSSAVLTVVFFVSIILFSQGGLAGLGVKEADARREAVYSLTKGYAPVHLAAKAFKAAPASGRAALVTAALAWVKTYVESPAFRADYEKLRAESTPTAPASKGTIEAEIAKQRAEQRKGIAEMRANIAKMPAEMRKQMEEAAHEMEMQVGQMEKDPQMNQALRQGLEMQRATERRKYEEQVKRHDSEFPADPGLLVARRLREFLEVSKDVDFSARLVPAAGGKMKFADARYEGKPDNWKLCFRAGKDVVDAARAFATEWLKQTGK